MELVRYSHKWKEAWNAFLQSSKNGHFFFHRDYMEYHSDRFDDYSFFLLDGKGNVIALFPANRSGDSVYSHQGLTFGSLVTNDKLRSVQVLQAFDLIVTAMKEENVKELFYKSIPYIYHTSPAQEDLYALFRMNAQLFRRDLSSSIDLAKPVKYSKGRKWGINKAKKEHVEVCEGSQFLVDFWHLLEEVLTARHAAKPVHSLAEMQSLIARFPDNIRLYVAKQNEQLLSGALLYINNGVIHTQYLANSIAGRDIGALDLLIHQLISEEYNSARFFDFGVSNEQGGKVLNEGLVAQKEGFGGRGVAHDFYKIIIS